MVLTSFIILGQAKHIVLELWFDWMGPDVAFRYWLLGFVVENLGKVLLLCRRVAFNKRNIFLTNVKIKRGAGAVSSKKTKAQTLDICKKNGYLFLMLP